MTYANRTDLEARFTEAEIEQLGLDADDATADRTVSALADAASEIDSFIGVRYALPLPAGDWPLLRSICCDLARARLYDDAELEAPRRAAERARKKLAGFRDGPDRLVDADGVEAPGRQQPSYDGPEPAFTRDALAGY